MAAIFKLMPSIYRIFGAFQTISFNKAAIEKLYNEFKFDNIKSQNLSTDSNFKFRFEKEINIQNVFINIPHHIKIY